jgi:hypothetical protein
MLCLAALLTGCNPEAQDVTLAQLAQQQHAYDGRRVRTTGVLHTHPTPRHYWIADAQDHRVELLTDEDLLWRVGSTLTVLGRFRYADNRGRSIDVETITERP